MVLAMPSYLLVEKENVNDDNTNGSIGLLVSQLLSLIVLT